MAKKKFIVKLGNLAKGEYLAEDETDASKQFLHDWEAEGGAENNLDIREIKTSKKKKLRSMS